MTMIMTAWIKHQMLKGPDHSSEDNWQGNWSIIDFSFLPPASWIFSSVAWCQGSHALIRRFVNSESCDFLAVIWELRMHFCFFLSSAGDVIFLLLGQLQLLQLQIILDNLHCLQSRGSITQIRWNMVYSTHWIGVRTLIRKQRNIKQFEWSAFCRLSPRKNSTESFYLCDASFEVWCVFLC